MEVETPAISTLRVSGQAIFLRNFLRSTRALCCHEHAPALVVLVCHDPRTAVLQLQFPVTDSRRSSSLVLARGTCVRLAMRGYMYFKIPENPSHMDVQSRDPRHDMILDPASSVCSCYSPVRSLQITVMTKSCNYGFIAKILLRLRHALSDSVCKKSTTLVST